MGGSHVILDTNILIRLERELKKRERGSATRFMEQLPASRICITPTIAGEFCSGASMAKKERWEKALVVYEMLDITSETSWIYGEIYRDLAAQGALIGANDIWIAATALTHGLPIATGNLREFQRVRGLVVVPV
jgi:tRNA(fMet)-specific endonuclease VapC